MFKTQQSAETDRCVSAFISAHMRAAEAGLPQDACLQVARFAFEAQMNQETLALSKMLNPKGLPA